MELVTGRAGSPHITSQQDRQKHQGIWGDGAYILATGNRTAGTELKQNIDQGRCADVSGCSFFGQSWDYG